MPDSYIPIYMVPGICKDTSNYSASKPVAYSGGRVASGRYVDGLNTRFVAGFPEKIGGWTQATASLCTGRPNAARSWRASSGLGRLGIGTASHLYYWDGTNLGDITPLRTISSGSFNNTLSTTNGSAVVAVADASQNLVNNDWVYLSAASSIGGLTINGYYQVSSRSGTGYNITASSGATSTVASGGGAVAWGYPRVTLSGPFTTTNGSAVVSVAHTAHGATTGDYVTFSGASAINGITLSGEYQLTVVNANSYTVTAANSASGSGTGGGSVSVIYCITIQQFLLSSGNGYGNGNYGVGAYGIAAASVPTQTQGWTLAPYGSQLLACPIGGTIYVYSSSAGGRAYPLINAPSTILGMFVTPERFVVAFGINGNLMQMAWADQTDYTQWTTTVTNTANTGRVLQGGSYLIGGVAVSNGLSLFGSDRAMFALEYSGDFNVYASPQIGDNCGLVSPGAIVAHGNVAYWMGDKDFWCFNGSVSPLPSDDIRDYVFSDLNTIYQSKCFAGLNRAKKEVWFFYPSASSTEIDSYVIYHIDQSCWSIGTMSRTAWEDANLFSRPFGLDPTGILYQHEFGVDANGTAMNAYITAAPVEISNGSQNMYMTGFIPDFQRQSGNISLTILSKYHPQDTNVVDGPYTIAPDDSTPRIDLRSSGRMIGFELESDTIGGDFRLALTRVDAQPFGSRN